MKVGKQNIKQIEDKDLFQYISNNIAVNITDNWLTDIAALIV